MKVYHSNETVQARQVGEGGENVVTSSGITHAPEDSWIVESSRGGGTFVMDNDTFCETYFEPVKSASAAKKTASKSTQSSAQTAADRIKAVKKTAK